jgi:hypothetical protein
MFPSTGRAGCLPLCSSINLSMIVFQNFAAHLILSEAGFFLLLAG